MQTDILRGELERLFELDELAALSRDVLGFDPSEVGGTLAKGTFAHALTVHCISHDAVEALCDVLLATKENVDPRIHELRITGMVSDRTLDSGEQVGPFRIARPLGEGRVGTVYLARVGERDFRVKLLRPAAARDQRGLHRLLTLNRLIARISHPGLPRDIRTGRFDEVHYVAHEMIDGQTLGARMAWAGPMPFNEARALLTAILLSVQALHDKRLCHGDLHAENLIVARGASGDPRVVLVDAGCDRLRVRGRPKDRSTELFSMAGSASTATPEQLQGEPPGAPSDVYAFGALLYRILGGRPVFGGSALNVALGHLNEAPPALSRVAPAGWVPRQVERLAFDLLAKDPAERPQSASEVLELLEKLGRRESVQPGKQVEEGTLTSAIEALLEDPRESAAEALEKLVELGAEPARVAEAFNMAADILEGPRATGALRTALLLRAARLYEGNSETLPAAEKIYEQLLILLPNDELAWAGLSELKKRVGKFEELLELLLQKNEKSASHEERADTFSEIGRIYERELGERDQALVAFTQAFVERPNDKLHIIHLEQIAGGDEKAWQDVLAQLEEATRDETLDSDAKQSILLKMADWYQTPLARFDLATRCLEEVLSANPTSDVALSKLSVIYRRSQQWRQLGTVLAQRAATAPAPLARDLKTEAAELLEHQLADPGAARDLYAEVIEQDPGHSRAAEGLSRIYERDGDFRGLAKILQRKSDAQLGEERRDALCRLAEVNEQHLDDADAAANAYQAVLAENPTDLEALRGIDRVLSKAGRHRELLEVLEREVGMASTPRQKIQLLDRMAAVYEHEFLDHQRAAEVNEEILTLDRANQPAILALIRHYRALAKWHLLSTLYERLLELETDAGHRIDLALAWGRLLSEKLDAPEQAIRAYEMVLELDPKHEAALDAVARLKESVGDADAALAAILALAERAKAPQERARLYQRAATLLQAQGDVDRAIEQYKNAVDAEPDNRKLREHLRNAYVERGDFVAAMQLFERELENTDGDRAKANLAGQMARLARDWLHDNERAEALARRAIDYDPTELQSLVLLGDIAFEHQRFVEASGHYEAISGRADSLPDAESKRMLLRYIEVLARSGKLERASGPVASLRKLASADPHTLEQIARLTLEFGDPRRAVELYRELLLDFEGRLPRELRAHAEYRCGEALRRSGDLQAGLAHLERATELDPELVDSLAAQTMIHMDLQNWHDVIRLKQRLLEGAEGEDRTRLLLDLGDVLHEHLNERARASDQYLAALRQSPNDRRVLHKLMQLYSEAGEWNKLVEVVLKLAGFVDEPAQKAKYLETAGVVTAQQIGDVKQALEYYERAFMLNPSLKALDEANELYREKRDHTAVERLLRMRLKLATEHDDSQELLSTFTALAELYERDLGDIDNAIDAYEAAHVLEPINLERAQLLTDLYATAPKKFLEKAVKLQQSLLRLDPHRRHSYRMLRRFYSEAGDNDASWCLCQALTLLKLADADEHRFYQELRSQESAALQSSMTDEHWLSYLLHPLTDPLLTSVFALIEPAVIMERAEPLDSFGYGSEHRIDLSSHYSPISQSLHHAAGALGVVPPPTYENTNDPGGLSFLHTFEPSIVLGNAALNAEVPSQAAAFISARHLSYLRPGLYLRQLIGTGTGLKSWLFAAIKLTVPQFPVAPELEGPIGDAIEALKRSMQPSTRDHLTRVVTKMLESGAALDLKRWIAGVDLTADRAGLLLANDLDTAAEILEVSDESASAVSPNQRYDELVLYSVSPEYIALRKEIGVQVQA